MEPDGSEGGGEELLGSLLARRGPRPRRITAAYTIIIREITFSQFIRNYSEMNRSTLQLVYFLLVLPVFLPVSTCIFTCFDLYFYLFLICIFPCFMFLKMLVLTLLDMEHTF